MLCYLYPPDLLVPDFGCIIPGFRRPFKPAIIRPWPNSAARTFSTAAGTPRRRPHRPRPRSGSDVSYVLAIDQGTTGSRAIVFDRRGRAVASAYEEFPQYFPKPGWVEHDPEEIWRSVYRTIQKALASVPARSIAAVGITNQRETTVVWDRRSGRPVARAIVWQCRRTAGRCRELASQAGMSDLIRKKTGLPIDAYFSATKAEWILDRGGLRDRARRGRLAFGATDAWVLWKRT